MLTTPLPASMTSTGSLWRPLLMRAIGGLGFRVVATGLSFVTSILLARILGVTEYGIYVFVLSVIALASTFLALGMPSLLTREIARARGAGGWAEVRGLARCARGVTLAGGFAGWLAIVACVTWSSAPNGLGGLFTEPLVLGGATLPFMLAITLNSARLAGFEHVLTAQSLDSLLRPALLLLLVATAWLALGTFSASAALALQLASAAGIAGFGALVVRSVVGADWRDRVRTANVEWRLTRWLSAGVFLMANQLLVNATTQIDVLMLGWLSKTSEVATYHAASRGAYLVTFIFGSMTAAIAPSIARLHASGMFADLQALILRATVLAFFPVLALAVGLTIFGNLFLGLFGPDFISGWPTLVALLTGWTLCVVGGPGQTVLVMCGQHRWAAYAFAMATVINVVLGLIFIPTYGAAGAAFATAASLALVVVCWCVMAVRLTQLRTDVLFALTRRGREAWARSSPGKGA